MSGRNRRQRRHHHDHEHVPPTLATNAGDTPTREQIRDVFDIDAAYRTALAQVTPDEMVAYLNERLPDEGRKWVLGTLGLRAARQATRAAATQVLARLGAGGARRDNLVGPLFPVAVWPFGALTSEEWTALMGKNPVPALRAMTDNPDAYMATAGPAAPDQSAIGRLSLVVAADAGLACSAVALAFLGVHDLEAAEAYEQLRTEHPVLPPARDPHELTARARVEQTGSAWTVSDANDDLAVQQLLHAVLKDVAGPDDDAAGSVDSGDVTARLESIDLEVLQDDAERREQVLTGLDEVWGDIVDLLTEQVESMEQGFIPDTRALSVAHRFALMSERVFTTLDLMDRDGLRAALEALRSRNDANPARAWLLRLAAMAGPGDLTDEIEAVADLAREAAALDEHELDDALQGLLTVIELADVAATGGIPDVDALFAAQHTARTGLPAYGRLIYSASTGSVVVPAPEPPDEDSADGGDLDGDVEAPQQSDNSEGSSDEGSTVHSEARSLDLDDDTSATDAEPADTGELFTSLPLPTRDPHLLGDAPSDSRGGGDAALTQAIEVNAAGEVEAPDDQDEINLSALSQLASSSLRRYSALVPDKAVAAAPAVASVPLTVDKPAAAEFTDASVEPGDDHSPAWADAATTTLDRELIGAGRFALAADVASLTGASEASVAARQIAAYAQNVRSATGDMASAFSERASHVVREDLGDDRPGQLLAWAAAAKMAILAPPASPADTLINLERCIEDSPALTEISQALTEAARNGVVVVAPEAIKAAGALAAANARVRELVSKADELLTTSKHRTIKYVPANEVFQRWIAPDGVLGAAIAAVRANDTTAAPQVARDVVENLRGKGERNMVSVFATFPNRSNKAITAGPRTQLLDRWDEVITLCSEWAAACEQVAALENAARTDSWQSSALARLRAKIEPHRQAAVAALKDWERAEGLDGDGAPSTLLLDAFAACDRGVPDGDEPTRAFTEHSELLALSVPLERDTLALVDPQAHVNDVLQLAGAPELTAQEVYERLAARGAHDLTAILVAGTRALEPADGARLEARRNRDVPAIDLQVSDEVSDLRTRIDVNRLAGVLSDDMWSTVSARVAQLADPTRRDYENIRAVIEDISAELEAERSERIGDTRERIMAAVVEHDKVAEHLEHLMALCDGGQVSAAEERLQQAIEGELVITGEADPQHLRTFFPAVPDVLARHADVLDQLQVHLRDHVETPAVAELREVGVDLFSLSAGRNEQAKLAFSAWRRLQSKAPVAGMRDQEALAHILRQAGMEFAGHTFDKGSNRNKQWVTLSKVTAVGKALSPILGSGMSPGETHSLRVLLVRQNTTPSTVIEWMATEPGDRTVLALWLQPTALTAAEWRSLGEASRGRSHPPVIMFDLGSLVYLASQTDARRTTLASIALPFTSANPYGITLDGAAPEMFYGRTEERSRLLDLRGSSFVSGGRQLGKTTLLKHAARRFAGLSEHHKAVFISIYHVGKVNSGQVDPPERVWNHLWPELAARQIVPPHVPATGIAEAAYRHVRAWLEADERRQLLILLDEADDFLVADSENNRFVNVSWFRDLMRDSVRRVKIVLAGLHGTARFESLSNQPLSHLGAPIVVGPLRPAHAYELLTAPMAAMGFTFDSDMTVARALAYANNGPAQLQLLGAALVEHMSRKRLGPDKPPAVITADDVEEAFDQRLQAVFREKFNLTLNLDPRYKIIAYVVAQATHMNGVDASLTLSELSEECRAAWPEGFAGASVDLFRSLVVECVDLGVLAQDGTRFRLRTPTVLRLLGTDVEVFDELADASAKLVVPTISDGGAFRPRIDDQHHHASLTTRQIGALLKAEAAVTVIAGSAATGLDRVIPSLEHATGDVAGLTLHRVSTKDLLLSAAIGKAAGRTWLLVDARRLPAPEVARILDVAQVATDRTRQPVRTIVVAGPSSAGAWAGWSDRVDLARFEAQGLTMYADVNNLPYHEPVKIRELLTATGGWPTLIDKVKAIAHDPANRADAHGLLDMLAQAIQAEPGALAADAGITTQHALHATLTETIAFTEHHPEPIDSLAELLEEDPKLAASLRAAHIDSPRVALEALVALGALVADSEGRLSAEPVLRADLERAGE